MGAPSTFSKEIYDLIKARRDVRDEFLPTAIPEQILMRLLDAAHHAPSVGFQQPWNFIVVRDEARRKRIQSVFAKAKNEEANIFNDERQTLYHALKLEGIIRAPVNLVVTCNKKRDGEKGLGRFHNPQMSVYSCVCAVQNLWLAARAENIGVGWVSIYHEPALRKILKLPDHIEIIAYLCLGYVSYFYDQPELQKKGWRQRLPLEQLIFEEHWQSSALE